MEVIEVTEREVEIIEVIERGPQGVAGAAGAVGPQGPAGTTDYNNLTNKPTLGTAAAADIGTGAGDVAEGNHTHTSFPSLRIDPANGNVGSLVVGNTTGGQNDYVTIDSNVRFLSSSNTFKASLSASALSADRTAMLPNASGTLALTSDFAEPPAIGSTTRNTGAFTTLNANNGTITSSAPVLDLSQTWNNAAVAFTGLRLNVSDTASGSGTRLADFQVGSTSVFSVNKNGIGINGTSWLTFYTPFTNAAAMSGVWYISNSVAFGVNGALGPNSGAVQIGASASLGWSSADQPYTSNADLRFFRDAADTLAQRRTTNPQTFRLYNTFTDASNYERGFMRWSSNVLQIGTEKAGTGSARALELQTDGVTRLTIPASGGASVTGQLLATGLCRASSFSSAGNGTGISFGDGFTSIIGPSTAGVLSIRAFNSTDVLVRLGGESSSWPALNTSGSTLRIRLADNSGFAPLECAAITLNGNLTASTRDIVTDTTTGTKIGTGTTQKLGFWNATPAVQPAAVADATDAASTQSRLNDLLGRLRTIGIIAT